MEIKWYGTATLVFSSEGRSLLFDPFLPMNPALPRPDLLELAAYEDVFITHGHFDHLIDVPKIVAGGGSVFCSEIAAKTLTRDGVKKENIVVIKPGEQLERGPFKITVFRGKHIRFDLKLILKTVFNRRVINHRSNLGALLRGARNYPAGEVLTYLIETEGKRIFHMGSLSLDESEHYPRGIDILTIPFQGRSDLLSYTPKFINMLQPESIYLHHFDDAFPPVSSPVEVEPFIESVEENFPGIRITCPEVFKSVQC